MLFETLFIITTILSITQNCCSKKKARTPQRKGAKLNLSQRESGQKKRNPKKVSKEQGDDKSAEPSAELGKEKMSKEKDKNKKGDDKNNKNEQLDEKGNPSPGNVQASQRINTAKLELPDASPNPGEAGNKPLETNPVLETTTAREDDWELMRRRLLMNGDEPPEPDVDSENDFGPMSDITRRGMKLAETKNNPNKKNEGPASQRPPVAVGNEELKKKFEKSN